MARKMKKKKPKENECIKNSRWAKNVYVKSLKANSILALSFHILFYISLVCQSFEAYSPSYFQLDMLLSFSLILTHLLVSLTYSYLTLDWAWSKFSLKRKKQKEAEEKERARESKKKTVYNVQKADLEESEPNEWWSSWIENKKRRSNVSQLCWQNLN